MSPAAFQPQHRQFIEDLDSSDGEEIQNNDDILPSAQEAVEDQGLEFETLDELIQKLNHEDHSEDEGIEDYKIGGYHPCHIGEVLINRYVLIQKLGWGHFSTVWLAKDFRHNNYVAVKIIKSAPHYFEASYDEVEILQKIAKNVSHPQWLKSLKQYEPQKKSFDKDDCHVLNLLNSFVYKAPYGNHFCMVFEILGVNLLVVLKRYNYKGLPLDIVREITRQVMMGLDFLNRICRVIHTDLKPENVLLCLTEDETKKIVDDGQLANDQIYSDRLRLYRRKFGLGPHDVSDDEVQNKVKPQIPLLKVESLPRNHSNRSNSDRDDGFSENPSVATTNNPLPIEEQIEEIRKNKNLTKNAKKDKIKRLKQRLEKQGSINANNNKKEAAPTSSEQDAKKAQKNAENIEKNNSDHVNEPSKDKPKEKTMKELFQAFNTKLLLDVGPKLEKGFKVKIADLGNACWQHHHFATQIQTRQYRAPEVLTGSKYGLSADMWSLACMTFEMLTGQLLFNPRKDEGMSFGKNDDHLAQMMELLGRFPRKLTQRGSKAAKYFTEQGRLNRIPKIQNWDIRDVLIARYKFKEDEALKLMDFMTPLLNCYPERRKLSHEMLNHPWLTATSSDYFMDAETHRVIQRERYDNVVQKEELIQHESECEDASIEDNDSEGRHKDQQEDDAFYGYEKVGDIRTVDRSFMDLGYIGYEDGIFLDQLDTGPNWQFAK